MKILAPQISDLEVLQIVKPQKRKRTQSARTKRTRTVVQNADGTTHIYEDKSRNAQYRDRCKNIKRPKAYTARFNYTDWLEVQRRNAYVHITKDDIFRIA